MPTVTPQALTRTVQDFLSQAAGAVVLENGAIQVFHLGRVQPMSAALVVGGAKRGAACAGC
jgi:hypothetical protein